MTFYSFIRGLASLVFKLVYRVDVEGKENVPKTGRLIVCGNHSSMLDPIFLGISIKRQINFMTKKEMFKNKILGSFLKNLDAFPVDRNGADLKAVKNSLKILKQEEILGIFPEGTRVKGVNVNNAKPGIGMICIKGKSPVIPVSIDTSYKLFSKVKVKIGYPIDFSETYNGKLNVEEYKEISKTILEKIYELKN
ncbi:lysophospholipid acyltransferase family protein [Sporosalibacterium faouarense]|uniref:lysophospholipid acyltransferase family protein n=1 Tax=Sporosalibacterium faouarense TaxID=516123 RepID=UPI00192C618F|nr:lysophospholipid acyltransferase family protein [Sporosalibacterium faouarense]